MGSSREQSPHAVGPMLATRVSIERVPEYMSNLWWMERKLDGFRLFVVVAKDGSVHGVSRLGRDQDMAGRLPALYDYFDRARLPPGTVLDGELVPQWPPVSRATVQDFTVVTEVMKSEPMRAQMIQAERFGLCYACFDVLELGGEDQRDLGLEGRRQLLEERFPVMDEGAPLDNVSLTVAHPVDPEVIAGWIGAGGEGAMLKHARMPYRAGRSTKNGLKKVKGYLDADVVCVGYTEANFGKGGKFFKADSSPMIGAIRFGAYDRSGKLVYVGKCSGMLDSMRLELTDNGGAYLGRVVEVRHMGFQARALRYPQFRAWRDDKDPLECTLESIGG